MSLLMPLVVLVAGRRRRPGRAQRRRCRTWTWRHGRGAMTGVAGMKTARLVVMLMQPGRTIMAMRSSRMAGSRRRTMQQQREMMLTVQGMVMTRMMVMVCC
jgi:hypothetical protein